MLGSIELAGDQAAVPTENRLGFGDTGNLGEKITAETSADFSERSALDIGERHFRWQMRAQDPILGDEVLALEEKTLIHQTCRIRQQPHPTIVLHAESIW